MTHIERIREMVAGLENQYRPYGIPDGESLEVTNIFRLAKKVLVLAEALEWIRTGRHLSYVGIAKQVVSALEEAAK